MKPSMKNSDIITAVVQGVPVDVLIDSGALEVSLIFSDVLKYISYIQKPTPCMLKGISDKSFVADSYVILTIEFHEISIEADFVVVPASYMSTSIIIGADVLNSDGVTYIRSKNRQYLTRSVCHDNTAASNNIEVNTPLQGAEYESLMTVINVFLINLFLGRRLLQ